MWRKVCLLCGIGASVLYAAMTVAVAHRWTDYHPLSQTISELSAIGAPTRGLWVPLGAVYTLLMAAFGCGVWWSAGTNRRLRFAGGVLIVYGVLGLFWPPMHVRETLAAGGKTATDTLHLAFAGVTVVLMLAAMTFGAAALGRRFRVYTAATIAVLLVCGVLTSAGATRVEHNLPTPWIGLWERINVGVFLLWVVVFAARLWSSGQQVATTTVLPGR
jgi:hypothetical protein